MKKTILTCLVAGNAALAGTLAWRATSNAAYAQPIPPGANLAAPKYLMVPGYLRSLNASVIFVFDSANLRLGAIAPDQRGNFATMRTIAVEPIFANAETSGTPNDASRNRSGATPAAR